MLSENCLNFLGKSPRLWSFHMRNFCWSSLLVFEFALHLLWSQNPIARAGQGWPFRRWACSMEARQFFLVWSICGSMLDIPFFLAKFVESLGDTWRNIQVQLWGLPGRMWSSPQNSDRTEMRKDCNRWIQVLEDGECNGTLGDDGRSQVPRAQQKSIKIQSKSKASRLRRPIEGNR